MKNRKYKWLITSDEASFAAFTNFLSYFQSYFPYCLGWMPSFYDINAPVSSDLPNETKDMRHKTK